MSALCLQTFKAVVQSVLAARGADVGQPLLDLDGGHLHLVHIVYDLGLRIAEKGRLLADMLSLNIYCAID